jgi:hypothetical protein
MYREKPFAICDLFNLPFHLIRVSEILGVTLPISADIPDDVVCSEQHTVIVPCLHSL